MNKKIKIISTCLLLMSSLSIYSPNSSSILITKAYAAASTYSMAEDGELKSLDIQSTDGESLQLSDNYTGKIKSLTDSKEYYTLLDGKNDGVKIAAEIQGEGYIAKVFESDADSATPHDLGENISLLTGESTLYIRTYATQADFKKAVKDKEMSFCAKTYKINIRKSTADGSDDVGLETLTLDSGKVPIKFDRNTNAYNISVSEDQDDVEIKARPESSKYDVEIQGYSVDEDDYYKKDLHLAYGANVIKIYVTGPEYRIRIYTLNITRGKVTNKSSSTSMSASTQNNSSSQVKSNKWNQTNGIWQYYDSTGNPLKNTWFYDKNYGKKYYLKNDGSMATNWLSLNGSWYYLGQDGGMKTGWQYVNGKYYYMQSDGTMAKNTQINGYELGNDGAWTE